MGICIIFELTKDLYDIEQCNELKIIHRDLQDWPLSLNIGKKIYVLEVNYFQMTPELKGC